MIHRHGTVCVPVRCRANAEDGVVDSEGQQRNSHNYDYRSDEYPSQAGSQVWRGIGHERRL